MKIKAVDVAAFGNLKNIHLVLSPSINIIEGENESGKSTLMAFVSFMLYGADDTPLSFINAAGGTVRGSLAVVSERHGELIIEREAYIAGRKTVDKAKIISLPSMKSVETKLEVGEFLLGVNRRFFENSAFVSQKGASEFDSQRTSAAVQNILLSASEKMNPEKGRAKIDQIRKYFIHKKGRGGAIHDTEDRIGECRNQIFLNENMLKELSQTDKRLEELRSEDERLSALSSAIMTEKKARSAAKAELLRSEFDCAKLRLETQKNEAVRYRTLCDEYAQKNYRTRLRALELEIGFSESKSNVIDGEIHALEAKHQEYNESHDHPDGTCEKLVERMTALRMSSDRFGYGAVFAFVLALLFLVGGVTLMVNRSAVPAVLMLAAVLVSSVIAMWLLSERKKRIEERSSTLCEYGFSDDATIGLVKDTFDLWNSEKRSNDELTELIARKKVELSNEKQKLTDSLSELFDIVSVLAPESAVLDYRKQIELCEDVIDSTKNSLSAAEAEFRTLSERIEALTVDLSKMSEDTSESPKPHPAFSDYSDTLLDEKIHDIFREKDRIADGINSVTETASVLKSSVKDPEELQKKLSKLTDELLLQKKQLEIVLLADEAVKRASENIRSAVTPNLIASSDRLLSRITAGKYSHVGIGEDLSVNGVSGENSLTSDILSYGTNESVYLAFRISLCLVLCRNEIPPLLLDESLAHVDNKRSAEIMSMLSESGIQSLVFTCSGREKGIAEELGIEFGYSVI